MSYRDIKNFCEMTRVLGYPRLISVENFRQPNFPLLAEILKWLVKRYDPQTDIDTMDTDTEQDRVLFIKSVAQFMAAKAHIKLNTKKLYQADGYVVKELLKMTSVLYNALKLTPDENSDDLLNSNMSMTFDITSQLADLKRARELASEITVKGSSIHDLLGREVDLRELRTFTINRNLEITEVDKGIRDAIKAIQREGEKINMMLENIQADEKNLDEKIDKKQADLDRNFKRLRTLKEVRPAFMDEYEKLEKELEELYEKYLEKFRIQAYLEQQLDEYNRSEQEKFEESAKAMQSLIKKMREREKELLGNQLNDDDDIVGVTSSDSDNEDEKPNKSNKKVIDARPAGKSVNNAQEQIKNKQVKGNFGKMGGDISDTSDQEGAGDDDDDDDDEDDDDDDEITDSDEDGAQQQQQQQQQQQAQQKRRIIEGSFSKDRTANELSQRGVRIKEDSDSDF